MSLLDIDPDRTRALARELRLAAAETALTLPTHLLPALSPGPTAALAASLAGALGAVEKRSQIVSAHLAALSSDADTFVANVRGADASLGRTFGGQ